MYYISVTRIMHFQIFSSLFSSIPIITSDFVIDRHSSFSHSHPQAHIAYLFGRSCTHMSCHNTEMQTVAVLIIATL